MKRLYSILSLYCYVAAVKINKDTEQHIEKCIEIHEADTKGVLLGTVIQPPLCLPTSDVNENHFLLPKVMVWDPLKRYLLTCPTHQIELKPSFWFGKQQQWRQPRLLYDLNDNVLLVGRYYVCSPNKYCRFVSMDDQILAQLPSDLHIPFLLFHRSGCTRELVERVYLHVAEGRTFIDICSKLNALNYEHLHQRIQGIVRHGLGKETAEMKELVARVISHFRSLEIFNAPSRTLLESLFLQEFKTNRKSFANDMRKLSAQVLSFSILPFDNQWSEEYRYLLLIFNEHYQVITWSFSRSHDFEAIRPLFAGLHRRLSSQGVRPKVVYVNQCCEWRHLVQGLFSMDTQQDKHQMSNIENQGIIPGSHILVKQDLLYTIRGLMSTVPDKGDLALDRHLFQRDFTLVFRQDDDTHNERLKSTPEPSVIKTNLDKFMKRWETFGDGQLLSQDCRQAMEILSCHITNGCFSFIGPGEGSEGNIHLLNILQSGDDNILIHAKHLGPELLFAVLTVLFHFWNKSHEPKKVSTAISNMLLGAKRLRREKEMDGEIELSKPASNKESVYDFNDIDVSMFFPEKRATIDSNEQFGFIGQTHSYFNTNGILEVEHHSSSLRYATNIEDILTPKTSRFIITEMLDLHEILQNIGKRSIEPKPNNSFQLAHTQLHHMIYFLASNASEPTNVDQTALTEKTKRLDEQLLNFKLQRVPVEGDGDCAFASVIYQLEQTFVSEQSENIAALQAHLSYLGIAGNLEEKIFRLRALFVNEILSKREEYMLQYTSFMSVEQFQIEAEKFRYPHVFSGQLGDLVIKVLSIILQCPIAVITSMEGIPLVPFIPENPLIKKPLFIAFTQHGPGHYDATCPLDASQIENNKLGPNEDEERNITPCRCGYNSAKTDTEKIACANITGEDKAKYKTRCQCFKNGRDCSHCSCVNCGNEYNPPEILCDIHKLFNCRKCGKKPEKGSSKTAPTRRKRKRVEVSSSFNHSSKQSKDSKGSWTELENCLIEVVHSLLSSTCVMVSAENIWKVFNFVCSDPANMCMGLDIKVKSLRNIQTKLEQRKIQLETSLQKADLCLRNGRISSKNDLLNASQLNVVQNQVPTHVPSQHSSIPVGSETVHVINSVQESQPQMDASIPQAHQLQPIYSSAFIPSQPVQDTNVNHLPQPSQPMQYTIPNQVPAHVYLDPLKTAANNQAQLQYLQMAAVSYQQTPHSENVQTISSHEQHESQGVNLSQNAVSVFSSDGDRPIVGHFTEAQVQQMLNANPT